jgi:hypothetical protein
MSSSSELGPIDPQVTVFDREAPGSASSPSLTLDEIKKRVGEEGGLNAAYYPLLAQLDPALLDYCVKVMGRAKQSAEKWLSRHMLKGDQEKAKEIAEKLASVRSTVPMRWSSTG